MELAIATLKTNKAEWLKLKAGTYNATLNQKYDKLATDCQKAIDALEAEQAEAETPVEEGTETSA